MRLERAITLDDCLEDFHTRRNSTVLTQCLNGVSNTGEYVFPNGSKPEVKIEVKPRFAGSPRFFRRGNTFRGDVGSESVSYRNTSSQVALVQGNVLRLGR